MHSGTFARCWISRSSEAPGSPVNGVRLRPEWIAFRRHCQKVHPSHWMTHLGPPVMTRGVVEREGNALPRCLATFCALFSTIMHEAPSCLVVENGPDGELTPELTRPGVIFPPHLGPN